MSLIHRRIKLTQYCQRKAAPLLPPTEFAWRISITRRIFTVNLTLHWARRCPSTKIALASSSDAIQASCNWFLESTRVPNCTSTIGRLFCSAHSCDQQTDRPRYVANSRPHSRAMRPTSTIRYVTGDKSNKTSRYLLTLTAVGRSQLLARWPGTHSRILSAIQRAAQTVLGVYLKRTCSRVTSASSALGFLTIMRYTNPRTHSLTQAAEAMVRAQMPARVSTGDRDAVLRQIRWCAAVQTLVNCSPVQWKNENFGGSLFSLITDVLLLTIVGLLGVFLDIF